MTPIVPVTVVIPCYRCGLTIERAVSSVASQTLQPLELILVDDGSADETRTMLHDLCSNYPLGWIRLVLLDQNLGAASARNAGWDQAKGDYVAFLDADDAWHSNKIALQYPFMQSRSDVVVSGHGHVQAGGASRSVSWEEGAEFRPVSKYYVLLKNPFVTPSFMVRRDLPFRFLAGRRHMEDHYFLMQVAVAGLGIAKTEQPLATIYKNLFGDAGLSSELWRMQHSELENYKLLRLEGRISAVGVVLFQGYSWLKFFRRIVIVGFRKTIRRCKGT